MNRFAVSISKCPYFSRKNAEIEYSFFNNLQLTEIEHLIESGFRHFGSFFFRPVCDHCRMCIPYRIPIRDFELKKWQKRILKHTFTVRYESPELTEAFKLYCLHKKKFPEDSDTTSISEFQTSFFTPVRSTGHMAVYDAHQTLAAVCHFDSLPNSLSAVYTYYNIDAYSKSSLGSLVVLELILRAKKLHLDYLYLGYFIPGHRHMNYKQRFTPGEILDEKGNWNPFCKHDIVPV